MSTVFDTAAYKEIHQAAAEARADNAELHARLIEAGVTITLMDFLKQETIAESCPVCVIHAIGDTLGQTIGYWLQQWPADTREQIAMQLAKSLIEGANGIREFGQPLRPN